MDIQIIQIVDDYDKYEVDNKIGSYHSHNAHNGNQVSLISLSPSGTYAVTYSEDDNSIEGWIIESEIELDRQTADLTNLSEEIYVSSIKVNDNKIVCHTDSYSVEIFRMSKYQELQKIKLKSPSEVRRPKINFTKLNNLVIFDNERISIYTHGKNSNELSLISSHELSSYNEVILGVFIDDNNIWVISPNYLFHWDLGTLETFQLKSSYSLGFMITNREIDHTFTVISKGNLNVVKNCDKIAIFLKGVHFPIQNIKLEDSDIKIELCEVQNNVYLLAFNSLLKDEKQNITLYHITDINKQPMKDASMIFNKDDSKNKFILSEYNSKSKKAFGLINGKFQYIKSSDLNWHEVFESHKEENDFVGWNNYLCQTNYYNDTLAFPDMDNIKSLISGCNNHKEITFNNQKYKWKIDEENREFSVCSDKNNEYDKKGLDISWNMKWNWKLLNNNALALRYYGNTVGDSIKIYEYDINNKKIEIKYYYKKGFVKLNEKDFSGPLLPIMTIIGDVDTCNLKEIIDSIIKDSRCLAKYGSTLLPILIRSSDPTFTCYIEQIYDECMRLVKEDPKRNLKFLSIITLSMNDLYKKYSNYLTKLNSEMFMILDPFNDKIVNNAHFYTFSQEIEISKYSKFLKFFQYFYQYLLLSLVELRHSISDSKATQCITLIVPYIDYSRYPLEYDSWWKEIFYPRSSIFIKTCKKEFYSNWNGEAIIDFKWKTFGKMYYIIIWLLFIVFLVCFTIASYPNDSINQEIRIKLFKTSIAFGFFHLIFELRQLIYWRPKKYFLSIWNLFDLSAYLSATIASIYWIEHENIPDWALSISCLLLDLKFLLFFRIFKYFGVYFAIIFGVAKRVFSFLVVLAIIIASFAHAFFLLLHPQNLLYSLNAQNSSDPNNPWTLSNTYNQVDENGNATNRTAFIQVPSENTNLFYSYPTSLLATYLFLAGNQNSLSPWSPKQTTENTTLFFLMAVFSFLIVIYLMNLFIGLLNIAIDQDNDRASYLVQKAEVIAEIELFYLLPHQRRWRTWFPEIIYYRIDVEKARIYIKEAINKGTWKKDDWPEMKNKILKLLNIEDAIRD